MRRSQESAGAVRIAPLPPDVIAQIKSSIIIKELNDVIYGLLQNSFDADAWKIHVDVDFATGSCAVEDDGTGIAAEDFYELGGLGKPNCE